tara:strand:- start:40 stop:921 length:882 start_codon:yes stop_codon:yes gene_type:complete
MILSLFEFMNLNKYQELEEKLIIFSGGKNYGQVVFMAGGAGSGKGFAIKNFMQGEKFKVRDVDEWKKALIKLAKIKGDKKISGLNLRNPEDVFKLHVMVREKGIKDKTLDMLLNGAKKDRLPNILFDITMKDSSDISDVAPKLIDAGYDAKNIHLVWVLTDYKQAAKANKQRDRVVPDKILFMSHQKAAMNMLQRIKSMVGGRVYGRKHVDGQVHVILNNRDKTSFYVDKNGELYTDKPPVVKDFAYLTIKKQGKEYEKDRGILTQVLRWALENAPLSPQSQSAIRKKFDLGR